MSIWNPAKEIATIAKEISKIQHSNPSFPNEELEEAGVSVEERNEMFFRLHASWKRQQQKLIRKRKTKILRRLEKI